jgi:hypothetical protein
MEQRVALILSIMWLIVGSVVLALYIPTASSHTRVSQQHVSARSNNRSRVEDATKNVEHVPLLSLEPIGGGEEDAGLSSVPRTSTMPHVVATFTQHQQSGEGEREEREVAIEPVETFTAPSQYFPETGHNVWEPFLSFFHARGGVRVFGYPITEMVQEGELTVQYFERARMEIDPDTPDRVRIAPLGSILTKDRQQESSFQRHLPQHSDAATYFPSTGHNLSHRFRTFWEQNGGISTLGMPISEAFIEYHPQTNLPKTVQYFEHGRLEYGLDRPGGTPSISIGLVGQEYVEQQALPDEMRAPGRAITKLAESVFPFPPVHSALQNVKVGAAYFDGLVVYPGQHVSFLETVGQLTAQRGYVNGGAIVNGTIQEVIAGGICYLSTAVYRAVFQAGFDIVERHPHSLVLNDFSNPPGMDAAVYMFDGARRNSGDLDLHWQNDMDDPVVLTTNVSQKGILTVSVWGYDDGRQVTINEPAVQHTAPPQSPTWVFRETLETCAVQQIASAAPGMNITVERVVKTQDGEVLHHDVVESNYAPARQVVAYGLGIEEPYNEEAQNACLANIDPEAGNGEQLADVKPTTVPAAADETAAQPAQPEPVAQQEEPPPPPQEQEPQEQPPQATTLVMPALFGQDEGSGRATLAGMGITTVYADYQNHQLCEYPSMIISSLPAAGDALSADTPVVLGVCSAPPNPTPAPQTDDPPNDPPINDPQPADAPPPSIMERPPKPEEEPTAEPTQVPPPPPTEPPAAPEPAESPPEPAAEPVEPPAEPPAEEGNGEGAGEGNSEPAPPPPPPTEPPAPAESSEPAEPPPEEPPAELIP